MLEEGLRLAGLFCWGEFFLVNFWEYIESARSAPGRRAAPPRSLPIWRGHRMGCPDGSEENAAVLPPQVSCEDPPPPFGSFVYFRTKIESAEPCLVGRPIPRGGGWGWGSRKRTHGGAAWPQHSDTKILKNLNLRKKMSFIGHFWVILKRK